MFDDPNIFRIVARAGRMTEQEKVEIFLNYARIVMECIVIGGIYYFEEKEKLEFKTINDALGFVDKMFKELQNKNVELNKNIKDQLNVFYNDFLTFFAKSANPGDVMYLRVYLATKIKILKDRVKQIQSKEETKNIKNLLKISSI